MNAHTEAVRPWVIFHNPAVMDKLARRPLRETEMLSVSGVVESRQEKYGAEFLDVIREYEYPTDA